MLKKILLVSFHQWLWVWIALIIFLGVGCIPVDPALTIDTHILPETFKTIPFLTTETDPNQLIVLNQLVTEYQQLHPNIHIEIKMTSPALRGNTLLTGLVAGEDLGIFEIEPNLMVSWAEYGYLLDLSDLVDEIGQQQYYDGSLFIHNDAVYAIPYASSIYGLWLRKDWFQEYGLNTPQSYSQLLHAAQTLTTDSQYGIALPGGQNIAAVNYFSIFLWQNGGGYFSCDGELLFGNLEAIDAIHKWYALSQYSPPSSNTWGFSEQLDAFFKGRVGMVIYGGRLGVNLHEIAPDLANSVEIVFPPLGKYPATLGVWSRFAIANTTEHPEEAKVFLKWLTTGDRIVRYVSAVPGHMIPTFETSQQSILQSSLPYVQEHKDWIFTFHEWLRFGFHPTTASGMITSTQSLNYFPLPLANELFGSSGIVANMLQSITLGHNDPTVAWRNAVQEMKILRSITPWQGCS